MTYTRTQLREKILGLQGWKWGLHQHNEDKAIVAFLPPEKQDEFWNLVGERPEWYLYSPFTYKDPDPTTDIAAAMELLRDAKATGAEWRLSASNIENKPFDCAIFYGEGKAAITYAASEAIAISTAWVEWKTGERIELEEQ